MKSIDWFETLVVRDLWPPRCVAMAVAIELGVRCVAFADAREEAEHQTFRKMGAAYHLESIYAQMPADFLDGQNPASMAALEARMECEGLYPIPVNMERLRIWLENGQPCIVVSDTTLRAGDLCMMMEKLEIGRGAQVEVSNASGCFKSGGKLFRALKKSGHGIRVHLGNDRRADVVGALRAGIRPIWFPAGNATREEAVWAGDGRDFTRARLAGACRVARLSATGAADALRDVVANVLAPAMLSFFMATVERTRELGLRHIFFSARDCYLLHRMARLPAVKVYLSDISTHYLYASRRSWLLPMEPENVKDWVLDGVYGMTLRQICDLVGVPVDQVHEQAGIQTTPDERISDEDWERLPETSVFRAAVKQTALRERKTLLAYLQQEGVFGGANGLFVDIGWRGSLHTALNRMLKGEGMEPMPGFYFGLDVEGRNAERTALFEAQDFPCATRGRLHGDVKSVVEAVMTAPHGTTTGFRECEGRIVPIVAPFTQSPEAANRMRLIEETMASVFSVFFRRGDADPASLREPLRHNLLRLATRPTLSEAEALGELSAQFGQLKDSPYLPVGRALHVGEMMALFRGSPPTYWRGPSWHAGAMRRSFPLVGLAHASISKLRKTGKGEVV